MNKLRIGVIGTGHLGVFHVKMYSAIKKKGGIALVGVCDVQKDRAKEVSKKYHTKYFTDYHDMLDKVDAVSIVVPTNLHYKITKDFLEAGCGRPRRTSPSPRAVVFSCIPVRAVASAPIIRTIG